MLQTTANTLEGCCSGILNGYGDPISTSPLEGISNKTKTMKRQACGYRNKDDFRLKLDALHEAAFALIG